MTAVLSLGSGMAELFPDRLKLDAGEIRTKDFQKPRSITGQALGWIRSRATNEIRAALELEDTGFDILNVISGAWARAIVLAEYADPEIHPPGKTEIVHLSEHSLPLKADMIVTARIAGIGETEVPLVLDVVLGLKAAALSIRSGRIIAVRLGEVTVSVTISAADMKLLSGPKDNTLHLGSTIELGEGIAIADYLA